MVAQAAWAPAWRRHVCPPSPIFFCLQGPILLSLLSVFYTLHSEFMGSGGSGTPAGGPLHRLWSVAPDTAGRTAAGPKGEGLAPQGRHVRLADGEPAGGASSPEPRLTGLRVSMPSRFDAAEGGAAFSPDAHGSAAAPLGPPPHRQQLEQQLEPSVSLSLGRRPGPGALQSSPSLLAAMSAAAAAQGAEASGAEEGGLDELEEDGVDSRSQSFSASIGDSFSFNALRSLKLHDD